MSHYLQHGGGGEVAALVLIGNAPLLQPDWLGHPDYNGGGTLEFARQLQTALAAGPGAGPEPWRPLARNYFARGPSPAQVDHLLDVLSAVPDATRLGQFLAPRPQLLGQLSAIDLPVLLVHGEQDDIHLSESSDYMLSVLPDASLETFQRSGHMPFAEQPQAFVARLLEFLETL